MAARRDANEPEIVEFYESVGASVQQLNGTDIPDLLVGFRGQNHLVEVKGERENLKRGQAKWHQRWRGRVWIVRTVQDAARSLGLTAAR